ncbi:MAG: hypothetical protein HY332_04160 [Chloroflexi bacterium]|nr:hypothetical protein [Chloroflexota bacterium]
MKLPWDKDERRNGPVDPRSGRDPVSIEENSVGTLQPGDAISFWGEGNRLVTCVYDCAEGVGERRCHWRWLFLDDGSLVEYSADGQWRYTEHQIVPQGSALYSDIVGSGGVLEQFEARVRNDTVAGDPVFVELRGQRYRVTSTGTVDATRRGDAPRLSPWNQFLPDPEENVYFSLVAADDENQGVLGLWTGHVCLSFGRPIAETDVDGIYRRSK